MDITESPCFALGQGGLHMMRNRRGDPAVSACRKSPSGLSDSFLQSAARTRCTRFAYNSHTCSLRRILRQVHALTQKVLTLFFCFRKKFCEAFFYSLKPPG